jgi:hypothetical protein
MSIPNDDVRTQVEALREEVEALRAELATVRRGHTIRGGGRCPACGGTKIVHAREVIVPDAMGVKFPLSLAARIIAWTGAKSVAPFSVYSCTACGLVEWYVTTFAGVTIAEPLELVEGVESSGKGTPYR